MYYEERVINNRLCWRGTPDGTWNEIPYSELLERLLDAEAKIVEKGGEDVNIRKTL